MKKVYISLFVLIIALHAWGNTPVAMDHNGVMITAHEADWPTDNTVTPAEASLRDLRNGNYAIGCQDPALGTYLPNMLNYITGPEIAIPAGSVVQFDFYLRGYFSDPDEFPNVDYWGCELTIDGGATWLYISNPYGDPNGNNYVYTDATADWSSFVTSYSLDGRLDDYAGETIQFRWFFQSDDDTPDGEGIYFDDISLTVDGNQVYLEDFEDGSIDPYVSEDGTATPPMWHQTTSGAFAGQSWAMNDESLGNAGGYLDHWYQTLDSPLLTLPAGPNTITFMQNRNVEDPAGATDPYDGWDGTNIRISNNEGASWDVLNNVSPVYNSLSMYSFGFEFNEGPGIPGWGGNSNGWEQVTVTIPSNFDGQNVMIRWAFASDPAFSTPDSPDMFGWIIDDIDIAGVVTNDGETNDGWVAASQVPIAGDLWHIAFVAELPAPINLAATAGDELVDLTWAAPVTGTSYDQQWDQGAWRWFLNDAPPYGVTFDVSDDNTYISKAKFYMYGNPFDGTVDAYVYSVVDGVPADLLATVSGVEVPAYPTPATVDLLSSGLVFNSGEQFCLAVGNFAGGDQGLLADSISTDVPASGHSFVWAGTEWVAITDAYTDISNLAIRAETIVPGGGMVPESYSVYRREFGSGYGDPLVTGLTAASYSDNAVVNGTQYYYSVTASYSFGESPFSLEVSALPESQTVYELGWDDGTAEVGFNLGSGAYMGVKLTPEAYPVLIKRAKVFVNDTDGGNIIAYIWDDDGSNGLPGSEIARFGWSGLLPGWNSRDLTADSLWVDGGSFYMGLKEVTSTPSLGADTDGGFAGMSYYDAGDGWDSFANLGLEYNMMFRVDVDSAFVIVGVDHEATLPESYTLGQNYPNPFNPGTEIRYELPAAGDVTLTVYDLAGHEVDVLVSEHQPTGSYRISLDGSRMASGVYLYTLVAGETRLTRKMILLK